MSSSSRSVLPKRKLNDLFENQGPVQADPAQQPLQNGEPRQPILSLDSYALIIKQISQMQEQQKQKTQELQQQQLLRQFTKYQAKRKDLMQEKALLDETIMRQVLEQIEEGKQIFQIYTSDRQQEQNLFRQIEIQFRLEQPAQQLIEQVKQLNLQLEEHWKWQTEKQVSQKKMRSEFLGLLTEATGEALPVNLLNGIELLNKQWDENDLELQKRESERQAIKQKLTALTFNDLRTIIMAQELVGKVLSQEQQQTQMIQLIRQQPQQQQLREEQRQREQKSRPTLTENLSLNLFKGLTRAEGRLNLPMASPVVIDSSCTDYSQKILLKRINAYLATQNKTPISEKGHCHGIGVSWLLMMDWHLGDAYFMMRKVIASCRPHQLQKIGELIEFFLKLIDLGQNPHKYSNNTCTQQDLPVIMGEVNQAFSFEGSYNKQELEQSLDKRLSSKKRSMMTIQGFGIHKETQMPAGHTVNVISLDDSYLFFCANDESGRYKEISTIKEIVDLSWKQIFKDIEGGDKPKFIVNAVKSAPKPSWLITLSTFFSENNKLVEAIVGASVLQDQINNNYIYPTNRM